MANQPEIKRKRGRPRKNPEIVLENKPKEIKIVLDKIEKDIITIKSEFDSIPASTTFNTKILIEDIVPVGKEKMLYVIVKSSHTNNYKTIIDAKDVIKPEFPSKEMEDKYKEVNFYQEKMVNNG